jgi:hypothetical protein
MNRLDVGFIVDVLEVHVTWVLRAEVCMVSEYSIGPENIGSVYLLKVGSRHCQFKRIFVCYVLF